MKMNLRLQLATAAILLLVSTGCEKILGGFSLGPGPYEGTLTSRANGKTQMTLVTTEVTSVSDTEVKLEVAAIKGTGAWIFSLRVTGGDSLNLAGVDLKKSSDQCYNRVQDGVQDSLLCFDGRELLIDLNQAPGGGALTLIVDKLDPTRRPEFETPAAYSIAQLMERGMSQSFESRIQFEHVLQARLNAQMAAAALIPHLSAGTLISAALSGWSVLDKAVSDLLPFLFPSRWIRAEEASLQAQAQKHALVVMKADSGVVIEGISYAISRDLRILAKSEENLAIVRDIRDYVALKERLRLLPAGSADTVSGLVNGLEKAISSLKQLQTEEYAALAQASGFVNPKAITALNLSDAPTHIESPAPIDPNSILDVALQRSYELHQMDTLLDMARLNQAERVFAWVDPSGDSGGGLGIGLVPFVSVSGSQIQEITIKREQMQSLLSQRAFNIFGEIQQAHEAYLLAKEGADIQARRVERMLLNLRLGINLSFVELTNGIQDSVKGQFDQINAEYAYLLATSKVNRLLMTGPYDRAYREEGKTDPVTSAPIAPVR